LSTPTLNYNAGIRPLWFADLKRLPVLDYYEEAFSKATGVSLTVVPPDAPRQCSILGRSKSALCDLLLCTTAGSAACLETHIRAQRSVAEKLVAQRVHCFAGLTVVTVPVLIGGRHVATLVSGRAFRRPPTESDFLKVLNLVGGGVDKNWAEQARQAYFETPILTEERFEAITYLLNVFAQYLADYAARCATAWMDHEPSAVTAAKQFVQTHVEKPSVHKEVLQHVHVSQFYFCKLFKKATGMTLTEYVARVRVEKAKTLLVDPSLRITDVVYTAGFGSIPRFNSVFRRYVGMAPRQYRATLQSRISL